MSTNSFREIIKQQREQRAMSQREFAAFLGYTQAAISQWEAGSVAWMEPARVHELAIKLGLPAVHIAESMGYPVHPVPIDPGDEFYHIKRLSTEDRDIIDELARILFLMHRTEPEKRVSRRARELRGDDNARKGVPQS